MPRVCPARKPHDYIGIRSQIVDNLSLPFIAPLRANDYSIHGYQYTV
jgi:hypothetical protein